MDSTDYAFDVKRGSDSFSYICESGKLLLLLSVMSAEDVILCILFQLLILVFMFIVFRILPVLILVFCVNLLCAFYIFSIF